MSVSRSIRSSERKPREERWAELLEAATEVFAEKGYDAASLQDIAERVGILKGSIYYYIDSKADLLAHLLQDVHTSGLQSMRALAEVDGDPLTRLYNMIVGHVFYVCSNLSKTAMFLHEVRKLTPPSGPRSWVMSMAIVMSSRTSSPRGRPWADTRPDQSKLAAVHTLSSLNSINTWYHVGGDFVPFEIAQQISASTLMGLATPKGVRILAQLPPLEEVAAA